MGSWNIHKDRGCLLVQWTIPLWDDVQSTNFSLDFKNLFASRRKVVADKGYRGDSKVVTPLDAKNNDHRRAMSLGRARHETVNRRIKQWGALQQIWRHDNEKHAFSFRVVITIVQLEIENGRPLFQFIGYQDPLFT